MTDEIEQPQRALTFTARFGADTPDDMASALRFYADQIERGEIHGAGTVGGPMYGGCYELVTIDKPHEKYFEELKAYLDAKRNPPPVASNSQPIPCPDAARMGEFACSDRSQCWEPCGELGNSDEHARSAPAGTNEAVDASLGLKLISIRLPESLLAALKERAAKRGTRYQTLARELLIVAMRSDENAAGTQRVMGEEKRAIDACGTRPVAGKE